MAMCCYRCPDNLLWGRVAWWPLVYKRTVVSRCGRLRMLSARVGRLYGSTVAVLSSRRVRSRVRS